VKISPCNSTQASYQKRSEKMEKPKYPKCENNEYVILISTGKLDFALVNSKFKEI